MRNVLERLGSPEEIAAAAGGPPERGGSSGRADRAVVSFIPRIGYLIGARVDAGAVRAGAQCLAPA